MIRHYSDKRLYKNLEIAKIYSVIAMILAIIILIVELINKSVFSADVNYIYKFCYIVNLISIPLGDIIYIKKASSPSLFKKETKWNNDKINLLTQIISNFGEYYILIVLLFMGLLCKDCSLAGYWARCCGGMLVSHIFSWIATIFLIKNYIIIKKEFKECPPLYIQLKILEEEKILLKIKKEEENSLYDNLIEKCGFRFFIKYFEQIKNLPLLDVIIEENIDYLEIQNRIKIIKEIIEKDNVLDCCLKIKGNYWEFLTEKEQIILDKIIDLNSK